MQLGPILLLILVLDNITSIECIYSTIEFYSPHKTGSTANEAILWAIRARAKKSVCILNYTTTYNDCLKKTYDVVGIIRDDIQYDAVKANDVSMKIIVLRDPRDILISEFNSFVYTHQPPPQEITEAYENFVKTRKLYKEKGLSWYLRERGYGFSMMTKIIVRLGREDNNTIVLPYDMMIFQPFEYLSTIIHLFESRGLDNVEDAILSYCKDRFENMGRNNKYLTNHVSNPVGRYWKKLSLDDQLYLNTTYKHEITYLHKLNRKYKVKSFNT